MGARNSYLNACPIIIMRFQSVHIKSIGFVDVNKRQSQGHSIVKEL